MACLQPVGGGSARRHVTSTRARPTPLPKRQPKFWETCRGATIQRQAASGPQLGGGQAAPHLVQGGQLLRDNLPDTAVGWEWGGYGVVGWTDNMLSHKQLAPTHAVYITNTMPEPLKGGQ
ncbi:hypothetical protein HYH03_011052 [Edaphochlamys debaryana]|uniref:Uncharacterized protein n=1 Tax=Edaphochlamys debaryana TaxID=47281 RepID=A0A835XVP3_9CHLO|nr:hypothetical protein HYH03_011052 [Edaphochlamys debaryana]|eukprot:KAG2490664.1 hypothetical protein HYH03_011052 [Edaphochlamys debaryana]